MEYLYARKQSTLSISFHTHTIALYYRRLIIIDAIPGSDCCHLLKRAFLPFVTIHHPARVHVNCCSTAFFHFPEYFHNREPLSRKWHPYISPTVLLTVTFTPLTGVSFPFFRVLFRRLAYYGPSQFKVPLTKRHSRLFTLVVNYSVCHQKSRASSFLPPTLPSVVIVFESAIN